MSEHPSIMKTYSFIALIMNGTALLLNILSNFGMTIFNSASFILFLVSFFINIGLISLNFKYVNRSDPEGGRWIKNICWIYLIVVFLAILLFGLSPIMFSFLEINTMTINLIVYGIIFGAGILVAIFDIKNLNRNEAWQ